MPVPRRRFLALSGAALSGAVVSGTVLSGAVAAAAPAPPARPRRGPVLDVRTFGAVGDGRADDGPAVVRALDAARAQAAAGPTVSFPPGTYRLPVRSPLAPAPGVTLAGTPGRSVLRFEPVDFLAGIAVSGPDVTVDGLALERGTDAPMVLVRLGVADRFTLSRSALRGRTDTLSSYCHGLQLGADGGRSGTLALADTEVTTCEYGLFQTNDSPAVTDGVDVRRCTFARNTNTDLELNSPAGLIRRVTVAGSTFRDNDSPGFAIGLAHCADVTVTGNTMTNYRMEALHVEDHTVGVQVVDNTFTACGRREWAVVEIISGSRQVTVRGNRFDARTLTSTIPLVGALPGGSGSTAGGRPVIAPSGVTVADNRMTLAPSVVATAFDDVVGGAITGNRVDGAGGRTAAQVFVVRGGSVRMAGNTVARR